MRFHITTWPEGFEVEASDEEKALVAAIAAITCDGYLLVAVPVDNDGAPNPSQQEEWTQRVSRASYAEHLGCRGKR